jgi:Ser-tRNA(Ala) deacylase AlaX
MPILSSRFDGLDIRYNFEANHGLRPGDSGVMEIDWPRRSRLMRYHMLCKLVLAITNKYFGKLVRESVPEDKDKVGIVKVMAKMTDT